MSARVSVLDEGRAATIAVVDGDEFVRTVVSDSLRGAGFNVVEAASAECVLEIASRGEVEAILSDILLPGQTGLQMLRVIRAQGSDIPVVLMTGSPSLDTAIEAVDSGAFRYVAKSAGLGEVAEAMRQAVRSARLARWRREAILLTQPESEFVDDPASMEAAFAEALDGLWLAAQPIVRASDLSVVGAELLSRTFSRRFTSITSVLDVAEKLGRVPLLGRRVRDLASSLDLAGEGLIFINVHSVELEDEELFSPGNPLARLAPRVILEVTERHALDHVQRLHEKVTTLRDLGFRIAVDDMGSGHSGLNSFTVLRPDFAKVDLALVRGIDVDPYRQTLVRSLAAMCGEFGVPLVAEGVETMGERVCLTELGCQYLQGFLFGKPEAPPRRPAPSP